MMMDVPPFRAQLLKWVGNKQRFAHEIASYFPREYATYREPFLGSGAVLGTIAPERAVASDVLGPLVEIWQELHRSPVQLIRWYRERHELYAKGDRRKVYEAIRSSYNAEPNGADLVFLCRSCYGGVVRFRKSDGHMSTPCGTHHPISPESFAARVWEWRRRTRGAIFLAADFAEVIDAAESGDLVYCDPPYIESQRILYGAQEFDFERLVECIGRAKARGVRVALSIDGSKKSGRVSCEIPVPDGLFEEEAFVNCGGSMLRRFQIGGGSSIGESVVDRLLLTYVSTSPPA